MRERNSYLLPTFVDLVQWDPDSFHQCEGVFLCGSGLSVGFELGLARTPFAWGAASVASDSSEVLHQGPDSVKLRAVLGLACGFLAFCGVGRCGRGHRIACASSVQEFLVLEQQGTPSLADVPFHVVDQHVQKDVCADAVGQAMADGPDLQVGRLESAEGTLDLGQGLVVSDAVGGRQILCRQ